jgi:hypothetical protein
VIQLQRISRVERVPYSDSDARVINLSGVEEKVLSLWKGEREKAVEVE